MRKVVKNLEDRPKEFEQESTQKKFAELIKTGNTSLIKSELYSGKSYYSDDGVKQWTVRDHLNKYYHNKCAYCETNCKAEIEHYRPKSKVNEHKPHPGYYWLCIEWTNLMPSCHNCNAAGAKVDKFPIIGSYVTSPTFVAGELDSTACKAHLSPLFDEKPYLLHPEIDDPQAYFAFEIDPKKEGILIVGIDNEGRGKKTIEICQLNRTDLKKSRKDAITSGLVNHLITALTDYAEGNEDEMLLSKQFIRHYHTVTKVAQKPTEQYTLLWKYTTDSVNNFEQIVVPLIESDFAMKPIEVIEKIKLLVIETFRRYKAI